MSYQVLARKYRPKNFETLVGQEHVVRALTHALRTGRLHHAYLFTGTRGVGKTFERASIVTPGKMAPLVSDTLPAIAPVCCAIATAGAISENNAK